MRKVGYKIKLTLLLLLIAISSCRFDEQYEADSICITPFDISEDSFIIDFNYTIELTMPEGNQIYSGGGSTTIFSENYFLDDQYKLLVIDMWSSFIYKITILTEISLLETGSVDILTDNQVVKLTNRCGNSPCIYDFFAGNYNDGNYGSGNISIGRNTDNNLEIYLDLILQDESQNNTINLEGRFIAPKFCEDTFK